MQNQESMFEKSEPTPVRPINIDPREQAQRNESPPVEGNEEKQYKEYSEGYNEQTYGEPWQAEGEKIQPRQQNRGRKRGGIKPLVIVLLIIALVVGWGGMSSGRFVEGGRSMPAQVFTVKGAPTLVLNNGSGEVHVHAGNVNNIVVSASTHGFGMMQDNDGQMVRTEQDGNTVTVSPDGRSGMFGRPVDLDVTVPSATNLELHTTSGDIDVEGVNGQMTLATASGEIKGSNLSGALTINTNSGDVKLEDSTLRGENNFRSDSGKIEFQGSLDPQGSYQFQTNSGDVELKLPAASSFHLTHTSNNGDFENEFPQAENKDAQGPLVNIVTNSGDTSIKAGD